MGSILLRFAILDNFLLLVLLCYLQIRFDLFLFPPFLRFLWCYFVCGGRRPVFLPLAAAVSNRPGIPGHHLLAIAAGACFWKVPQPDFLEEDQFIYLNTFVC